MEDIQFTVSLRPGSGAGPNCYLADYEFYHPDNDADNKSLRQCRITLDPQLGLETRRDSNAYGRWLADSLFGAGAANEIGVQLQVAEEARRTLGCTLRFRLALSVTAEELHDLHWEKILNPLTDFKTALATDDNVVFSRRPLSEIDIPIRLRPQSHLRALVIIANPPQLRANVHFHPLNEVIEKTRASSALDRLETDFLITDPSRNERVTVQCLEEMVEREYDIWYLICHGTLDGKQPRLFLDTDEGEDYTVAGEALIKMLRQKGDEWRRPVLMVLSSCESAGSELLDNGSALASLGAQLVAKAGIGAVMAMQGQIAIPAATSLMSAFFDQLAAHGNIEAALAYARRRMSREVQGGERHFWRPVLLSRLKKGSIWLATESDLPQHKLGKLESIIATADYEWRLLEAHYQACMSDMLSDTAVDSVEQLIGKLADRRLVLSGGQARSPMLDFVASLYKSSKDPEVRRNLNEWLQDAAVDLGLDSSPKAIKQFIEKHVNPEYCLLVKIEPRNVASIVASGSINTRQEIQLTIRKWVVPDKKVDAGDPLFNDEIPLDSASTEIANCIARTATSPTVIEIFLPDELISMPVDWWPYEEPGLPYGIPQRLGGRYRVVVRSLTRVMLLRPNRSRIDNKKLFADWVEKWRIADNLATLMDDNHICTIDQFKQYTDKKLLTHLQQDNISCLVAAFPPLDETMEVRKAFHWVALIQAAIPVALWTRRTLPNPQQTRQICETLQAHAAEANIVPRDDTPAISALPEIVKKLRETADDEDDPEHVGSNLTLLWDNPHHLFPEDDPKRPNQLTENRL